MNSKLPRYVPAQHDCRRHDMASGWAIWGMIAAGVIVVTALGFTMMETRDIAKYLKLVRMSSGRQSMH